MQLRIWHVGIEIFVLLNRPVGEKVDKVALATCELPDLPLQSEQERDDFLFRDRLRDWL